MQRRVEARAQHDDGRRGRRRDVAHPLHAAGVDTWIRSGRDAHRLVEILRIGEAPGTRIAPIQ